MAKRLDKDHHESFTERCGNAFLDNHATIKFSETHQVASMPFLHCRAAPVLPAEQCKGGLYTGKQREGNNTSMASVENVDRINHMFRTCQARAADTMPA